MKKRMSPARSACSTAGATSAGDFTRDALEREVGLQYAGEHLRLVEPDLRAGEGMLAGLQHHALIGHDRLVARIAVDLDVADGDARVAAAGLLRKRLSRRRRAAMMLQSARNQPT